MGGSISNAALGGGDQPLAGKTMLYPSHAETGVLAIDIHTVTAGKIFYMLSCGLCSSGVATAGYTSVYMRGGTDMLIRLPITANNLHAELIVTYPYPIPIAAGTVITMMSTEADITGTAYIVGWEE